MTLKNAHYFSQTYPQFSSLNAKSRVGLRCEDLMKDNIRTKNNVSQYQAELIGPFMFFNVIIETKSYDTTITNFYIFCPFYMTKFNVTDCSLDFIPIVPFISMNFSAYFQTYNEAVDFQRKILKAKTLANTPDLFCPPLVAPVIIYNIDNGDVGEFEINSQGNIINFSNKMNVRTESITIDEKVFILNYSPFEKIPDNFLSISFTFNIDSWKNRCCICNNREFLEFIFFTIYLSVQRNALQKRNKPKQNVFLSTQIPIYKLSDKEINKFEGYFCKETATFNAMPTEMKTKHEIDFQKVSVPTKASTKLELLSFDFPIQRRVFAVNKSSSQSSKAERKAKTSVCCLRSVPSFDKFMEKEKKMYSNICIDFDIKDPKDPIELSCFAKESDIALFEPTGLETLNDFLCPPVCCKECKNFCDKISLFVPQTFERTNGYLFSNKIGRIVVELGDSFDFESKDFSLLCSGIAQVFLEGFIDVDSFMDKFKDLLKETKLIGCLNSFKELSTRENLILFIARIIKIGKLSQLLSILSTKRKSWRIENYLSTSPMQSAEFVELLRAVTAPLQNCRVSGRLDKDSFCKTKWGSSKCLSPSVAVKHSVDKLIESALDAKSETKEATKELINEIIEFFKDGFVKPSFSPVESMRHPWYCFVAGSAIDVEGAKQIEKMRDVVETLTTLLSNPEEMLHSLLYEGLKFGMIGEWVLLACAAGESEGLFKRESPIADHEEMLSFSNALFPLSDIYYFFN